MSRAICHRDGMAIPARLDALADGSGSPCPDPGAGRSRRVIAGVASHGSPTILVKGLIDSSRHSQGLQSRRLSPRTTREPASRRIGGHPFL